MASNIPSFMTREYLQGILQKSLKSTSIRVTQENISPASVEGDGYTCQIFRIKLKYVRDGKEDSIAIIGKYLPKTELSDELTKGFDIFKVEVNYLIKTLPRLVEKFPEADFAPYAYYLDEEHQVLYMEDCCASGYVMAEAEGKVLDMDHCLVLMRQMARMHGFTYLMIKEDPSLKETFSEYFWKKREELGVDMQLAMKGLDLMVEKLDKWTVSDDLKERLRNLKGGKILDLGYSAYERKPNAMNVLAHGDVWLNNTMFKYDKQGRVEDVKILDFQFTSYNAIGIDLNFFIFSSMDERIQMDRLGELFQHYYKCFLEVTGPIPGFTLESVWQEFRDRLGFGFIVYYIFRAGIIAPKPFDLDALTKGLDSETNRELFQSEHFISEGSRLLPFFAQHGLI